MGGECKRNGGPAQLYLARTDRLSSSGALRWDLYASAYRDLHGACLCVWCQAVISILIYFWLVAGDVAREQLDRGVWETRMASASLNFDQDERK